MLDGLLEQIKQFLQKDEKRAATDTYTIVVTLLSDLSITQLKTISAEEVERFINIIFELDNKKWNIREHLESGYMLALKVVERLSECLPSVSLKELEKELNNKLSDAKFRGSLLSAPEKDLREIDVKQKLEGMWSLFDGLESVSKTKDPSKIAAQCKLINDRYKDFYRIFGIRCRVGLHIDELRETLQTNLGKEPGVFNQALQEIKRKMEPWIKDGLYNEARSLLVYHQNSRYIPSGTLVVQSIFETLSALNERQLACGSKVTDIFDAIEPSWQENQRQLREFRQQVKVSIEKEPDEVVNIQDSYAENIITLLKEIFIFSEELLGPAPGKFSVIILGSLNRRDGSIYGDADLVFVVDKKTKEMLGYLQCVNATLRARMNGLNEGNPKRAGFHLDHNSIIIESAEKLNSIGVETVDEYVSNQKINLGNRKEKLKADGTFGDNSRLRPVFLYGDKNLFDELQAKVRDIDKREIINLFPRTLEGIALAEKKLSLVRKVSDTAIDVKDDLLRPLSQACIQLGYWYGLPEDSSRHPCHILEWLSAQDILSAEFTNKAIAWLKKLYCVRFNQHLAVGLCEQSQRELIELEPFYIDRKCQVIPNKFHVSHNEIMQPLKLILAWISETKNAKPYNIDLVEQTLSYLNLGKLPLTAQHVILNAIQGYSFHRLVLRNCAVLDNAKLREMLKLSPTLVHLDVSGCEQLTSTSGEGNDFIADIASNCKLLETLIVSRLPKVESIVSRLGGELRFSKLIIFNASGCITLKALDIDAPELNKLILGDCVKLTQALVKRGKLEGQLREVDLSGCILIDTTAVAHLIDNMPKMLDLNCNNCSRVDVNALQRTEPTHIVAPSKSISSDRNKHSGKSLYISAVQRDTGENMIQKASDLFKEKRYYQACACFVQRDILETFDKNIPSSSLLFVLPVARYLDSKGQYEQALFCYRQLLEGRNISQLDEQDLGDSQTLLLLKWIKEAEEQMHKPKSRRDLFVKGCKFEDQDKYLQADEFFALALTIVPMKGDPVDAEIYLAKGKVLYNLEKYADAVACFDAVLTLSPTNVSDFDSALYMKARAMYCLGEYVETVACYNQTLRNDKHPNSSDLLNMAHALTKIYKCSESIIFYIKYLAIQSRDVDVYVELGQIYVNQNNYAKALEQITKVLEINSKHIKALELKKTILESQAKLSSAVFSGKIEKSDLEQLKSSNGVANHNASVQILTADERQIEGNNDIVKQETALQISTSPHLSEPAKLPTSPITAPLIPASSKPVPFVPKALPSIKAPVIPKSSYVPSMAISAAPPISRSDIGDQESNRIDQIVKNNLAVRAASLGNTPSVKSKSSRPDAGSAGAPCLLTNHLTNGVIGSAENITQVQTSYVPQVSELSGKQELKIKESVVTTLDPESPSGSPLNSFKKEENSTTVPDPMPFSRSRQSSISPRSGVGGRSNTIIGQSRMSMSAGSANRTTVPGTSEPINTGETVKISPRSTSNEQKESGRFINGASKSDINSQHICTDPLTTIPEPENVPKKCTPTLTDPQVMPVNPRRVGVRGDETVFEESKLNAANLNVSNGVQAAANTHGIFAPSGGVPKMLVAVIKPSAKPVLGATSTVGSYSFDNSGIAKDAVSADSAVGSLTPSLI